MPCPSLALDLGLVVDCLINSVSRVRLASLACFCCSYHCSCFSDDPAIPIAFICFLLEDVLSVSSLQQVLSGVSLFLRVGGIAPLTSHPMVWQMLKGLKRLVPISDWRCIISLSLLSRLFQVLPSVCFSVYESLLFRSAFLSFFGAFRISALASVNRSTPSGLAYNDVCFCEEYLLIWLLRSKTDQFGKGRWIRLNRFLGSPLCPVEALCLFIDVQWVWPCFVSV